MKAYQPMISRLCLIVVLLFVAAGAHAGPSDRGYSRVMQGPMVGAVTPTSVSIWCRVNGPFEVAVEYGLDEQLRDARRTESVRASAENDYAVVVELEELPPGSDVYYRPLVNGKPSRYYAEFPPFRTHTAPDSQTADFAVAFGSCARYQEDRVQPIWDVVVELQPDLFLWLGDNMYGDSEHPEFLAEEWRRQRDVASLQPVNFHTPQLAIWDDHDYGLNNHDRTNPIKDEALAIFSQYWANPAAGLPDCPGVFFSYSYSGVDFYFLDVRYHRDPNDAPRSPDKTMLGACQLQWLKDELSASTASFKLLLSGSPWSKGKGDQGDSWSAFLEERDALLRWVFEQEIEGVVLLSGDTHVGELNAIPLGEEGGYDIYELGSSPLAQDSPDPWTDFRPEMRIRPVYLRGPNIGWLRFEFSGDDPTLQFDRIDATGRRVQESLVLRTSELRNGVSSWRDHIDPSLRERYEP